MAARMPRRRRWYLAAAALALLVAGGVASYGSVYQPLVVGSISGLDGDQLDRNDRMVIRYHDGTLTHGLLALRNDGRWPVRVERVGEPPGPQSQGLVELRPESNVLNPPNANAYAGPPFEPFTLRPGEVRAVAVGLWLDHCEFHPVGAHVTVTEVRVRFRAFGMARTAAVRLSDGGWTVRVDQAATCPRPPAAP
jgi:hypothetical protein